MKYKFDEINHIHTLDGKPLIGTSTVVGVIAKPLTWWAAGLAVEKLGWIRKADPRKSTKKEIELNQKARELSAGQTLTKLVNMYTDGEPEKYLALLDSAYRAHADTLTKSADKGTDMHAELEEYVKRCIAADAIIKSQSTHAAVQVFSEWARANAKRFIVSEGHCYSERLWTGGISDLLFEDNQGRLGIMDFKSSKEAYLSQFFQIAGYDIEISENGLFDAEGELLCKPEKAISYYAVFPFGMAKPEPQFYFDTKAAQNGFEAALVLHKLITQHDNG